MSNIYFQKKKEKKFQIEINDRREERIDHWHFLRNDLIIQRFLMLMQYPYDAKQRKKKETREEREKEREEKKEKETRERRKCQNSKTLVCCFVFL